MRSSLKKSIALAALLSAVAGASYYYYSLPSRQPSPPEKEAALTLKATTFERLPGWREANLTPSFEAFLVSCTAFLRHPPSLAVGSTHIHLEAKDWQPLCAKAKTINPDDTHGIREFFEHNFTPTRIQMGNDPEGLFTGYYMPYLHGSTKRTKHYNIPIYTTPDDLVTVNLEEFDPSLRHRRIAGRVSHQRLIPYYTRAEINKGAINNRANVLAWVDSPVDRLFLEIQGSGIIKLKNGDELAVGYAAQNGRPYTAIGAVLAKRGLIAKEKLSMQTIKTYLETHPNAADEIINHNASFVFFKSLSTKDAYGAQGVKLTPGYSLAVDRQFIPMGTPIWLNTTHPDPKGESSQDFKRLMIAQDTGGAIKGAVRGDVYWGAGDDATEIAGRMKNVGVYWLLLPKKHPPSP